MRTFSVLSLLGILLTMIAAKADICSDPLKGDLCYNMRFLRSQVMALGEQRELMQVNYPYLGVIGAEINAITSFLEDSKLIEQGHLEGLTAVKSQSQTLMDLSKAQDPLALAAANTIQKKCAACHNQTAPQSGIGWDQIFKTDWEHISKNCSTEGRTPYLCRSMNGMLSAYSGILAAAQLGRQNYASLLYGTTELSRIASDLKEKRMFHGSEVMMDDVLTRSQEVIQLASAQKPEAFEKGLNITQACMQCHANMTATKKQLAFKQL